MFKVNNKDTRMTPMTSAFNVNFKHVNAGWVIPLLKFAKFEYEYLYL